MSVHESRKFGRFAKQGFKYKWLAALVLLSACAKSSNTTSDPRVPGPAPQQALVSCAKLSHNTPLSAPLFLSPFEVNGKVLLEGPQALPEKSELTVTLREQCSRPDKDRSLVGSWVLNHPSGYATPSGVRSHRLILPKAMSAADLSQLVKDDPCIVGISPSLLAQPSASVPDDPLVASQAHLAHLGVAAAYTLASMSFTSALHPVTIAIIDTGVDLEHEDLKNVLWKNPGEIPTNGIDDDKNGYVDDVNGYNFALEVGSPQYLTTVTGSEHGTHVAGLAVAEGGNGLGGAGVAGAGVRLMALNVYASATGAYLADIANAIRYAADNGADIINLSLDGEGRSAEYEAALAYAINKGVTVIASAGNDHAGIGPDHFIAPASYARQFEGMLAVASVDTQSDALSFFSNFGADYVRLAAPGAENSLGGVGLLSTWPGNKYERVQGTSMAAPVAAGAAAFAIEMLRDRGYKPSPAAVVGVLTASARHNPALDRLVDGGHELGLVELARYIDSNFPTQGCGR